MIVVMQQIRVKTEQQTKGGYGVKARFTVSVCFGMEMKREVEKGSALLPRNSRFKLE